MRRLKSFFYNNLSGLLTLVILAVAAMFCIRGCHKGEGKIDLEEFIYATQHQEDTTKWVVIYIPIKKEPISPLAHKTTRRKILSHNEMKNMFDRDCIAHTSKGKINVANVKCHMDRCGYCEKSQRCLKIITKGGHKFELNCGRDQEEFDEACRDCEIVKNCRSRCE